MPARQRTAKPEDITPAEFPKLKLPIRPPYPPMEARTAAAIPTGKQWLYEPKWDGFRCLAFRDGHQLVLQSKAGQPLGRYFPELVQALLELPAERFILDGEIVIEADGRLDFDALLQRIHPAESRIKKLSRATPCQLFCFDLLVDADGKDLTPLPLVERKDHLRRFVGENLKRNRTIRMSQSSPDLDEAQSWFTGALADFGCDGIIAKLKDEPYHSGDRDAMFKIKRQRTADCVVGGFRYAAKKEKGVGSLLLGLYNDAGELDHVGFCSSFTAAQRLELVKKLAAHKGKGFTGKAPGGPSRWSRMNEGRSAEWEPLDDKLVVEVQYDHLSNGRFRHGTKFLRWRPDKAPRQCTFQQLRVTGKPRAA